MRHKPTRTERLHGAVAAVVAAVMMLTACGTLPETETGAVVTAPSSLRFDAGPQWQPNGSVLDDVLTRWTRVEVLADPEKGFAGIAAPAGLPYRPVEPIEGRTQSVNNTEPIGHPDSGPLETVPGAEYTTGVR